MTSPAQENQVVAAEQKPNDKEYNFRALEAKFQQERQARLEAERKVQEAERLAREMAQKRSEPDDDEDDEPYVNPKKLDKKLSSFEKRLEEKIDKRAEEKARSMLDQQKKESWMRSNPDFYEVLQHAEKFAQHDPELAETILEMPEGFERQKLVYKNIKALGLHKPQQKEASIQDKIDANRRGPYYQPTNVNAGPYAMAGDFSQAGQKNAYQKMQELKARLRM